MTFKQTGADTSKLPKSIIMAIVQNPIIGAAKKSAGGMVFSRSLDQNIIRAKPITYNDKNSDAQKVVRGRMANVSGLTKADSKKALDAIYPTRPAKQTKYSRYVQQVMKAFPIVEGAITPDWSKVSSLGNGSLNLEFTATNGTVSAGKLAVTITGTGITSLNFQKYSAILVVFNTALNLGSSEAINYTSASGEFSLDLPENWNGSDTLKLYVGVMDKTIYNSTQLTPVTIS